MTLEELIKKSEPKDFIPILQDADTIMAEFLLNNNTITTPQDKRYLNVFCCYAFRYCKYAKEITQSLDNIKFLAINCVARSAEIAWNRGKIDKINGVLGIELFDKYDRSTNGELIALLADKLLLESA